MSGPLIGNQPQMPVINPQEPITIAVIPMVGIDVQFIIKRNTPLIKLMKAYCHKLRIPLRAVRFLFDGRFVIESDTAESLGIENGDEIDVFETTTSPIIVAPHELASTKIIIKILRWDNLKFCYYFIERTTPVIRILNRYCKRSGDSMRAHRFSYEGVWIENNDTPESLDMDEGDTLDIFYAQEGGGSF